MKNGACLSPTQIKLGSNKDMTRKQTKKAESKKTLQAQHIICSVIKPQFNEDDLMIVDEEEGMPGIPKLRRLMVLDIQRGCHRGIPKLEL